MDGNLIFPNYLLVNLSKKYVCINKDEVIALLTQDSYYRKLRRWPLLTSEHILRSENIHHHVEGMLSFSMRYGRLESPTTMKMFTESLNDKHPFITELLLNFKGNLVAAGGSICKRVINYRRYNCEDIDLFFHNLTITEANELRRKAIMFIVDKWKLFEKGVTFSVTRNEYVTTVYVYGPGRENEYDNVEKDFIYCYQLVHRIYPDISSIIGGFDISACMIAYDGEELYTTPLGAWALKHRSIIVDTKRRSTSFEYRLIKYHNYGFELIFPGLSSDVRNYFKEEVGGEKFNRLMKSIKDLIQKEGFVLSNKKFLLRSYQDTQNIQNILPKLFINDGLNYCRHLDDYEEGEYDKSLGIGTVPYNKEQIEERYLKKISDYHHDHMWAQCFPKANAARLRNENLRAVVSILTDISSNSLLEEEQHPNIGFGDNTTEDYKQLAEKIRFGFMSVGGYTSYTPDDEDIANRNYYFIKLAKCFGKLTPEVMKVRETNEYYDYINIMIDIMKTNAAVCQENLVGIKWITQDPGRQWTSSINPIITDPREWYGQHYQPVVTGIPAEIETTLRLINNREWSTLPAEIFDLILVNVAKHYADIAWQYI